MVLKARSAINVVKFKDKTELESVSEYDRIRQEREWYHEGDNFTGG